METVQSSAWNQSYPNFGFSGNVADGVSRSQETAALLQELRELHNLDENEWNSGRRSNPLYMCNGSFNKERKVTKVDIKFKAPYKKVLTYGLYPPYGYRNVLEDGFEDPKVTEYLGGGAAAVVYYHEQKANRLYCCCPVNLDLVALCVLKLETPNIAFFGMKSTEHPSHPEIEGVYRTDRPLLGLCIEQKEDFIHMTTYSKEIETGRQNYGTLIHFRLVADLMWKSVDFSLNIPMVEDIIAGEPPFMRFM